MGFFLELHKYVRASFAVQPCDSKLTVIFLSLALLPRLHYFAVDEKDGMAKGYIVPNNDNDHDLNVLHQNDLALESLNREIYL